MLYPVLVILAIAAVIYWIENRNDDATSSTGQTYGIREMNSVLNPDGLDVEAAEGSLAPDFDLETVALTGSTTNGEAWLIDRGTCRLNFWATWCFPAVQRSRRRCAADNTRRWVVVTPRLRGAGFDPAVAQKYGLDYNSAIATVGR